ncbi:MAG: hypothetical protein HYT80_03590 [Euryarchaeota archaeon]|nr:hypothetical protein [Euryarchaeota archaeon]
MGWFRSFCERWGIADLLDYKVETGTRASHTKAWMRASGAQTLADVEAIHWAAKVTPVLEKLLAKGNAGAIRSDLMDHFVALLVRTPDQRELLVDFRGWISPIHYKMLLLAVAAANERAMGRDQRSISLVANAEKKFGPDARKIHNLLSAGYISSIFIAQRRLHAFMYQSSVVNAKRLFQEWFEEQLSYFERAVFVNDDMALADLAREISTRLLDVAHPQPFVSVWAAGVENVSKAADAVTSHVKTNKAFEFNILKGKHGKAFSVRFIVYRKHECPTFKPSRLELFWEREARA